MIRTQGMDKTKEMAVTDNNVIELSISLGRGLINVLFTFAIIVIFSV
jgi:hypothetical protein